MKIDSIIDTLYTLFGGESEEEELRRMQCEIRKKVEYIETIRKLTQTGYCPKCKKLVIRGDKYCSNCGTKLDWSSIVH
jgi:hypothetical protein